MERVCAVLVLSAAMMLSVGCSGDKPPQPAMPLDNLRSVSPDTWKKLSEEKIFFGHQSVGQNILDGITDIMRDSPKFNSLSRKSTSIGIMDQSLHSTMPGWGKILFLNQK